MTGRLIYLVVLCNPSPSARGATHNIDIAQTTFMHTKPGIYYDQQSTT